MEKISVDEFKFNMKDMDFDSVDTMKYDVCQPKFDGWWTMVIIENKHSTVITSGGEEKFWFDIDLPDCVLLCEWIHGTNWAQSHKCKEKFVIFDCLKIYSEDLKNTPYCQRMDVVFELELNFEKAFNERFIRIESTDSRKWKNLWEVCVINSGFEGIVFKNSSLPFNTTMGQARLKKIATMNYIVKGFKEGTGRLAGTLGAVEGGLMIDGVLQRVCTVGGGFSDDLRDEIWFNREMYLGKVFEARGKILFTSGALRHPAFTKWRDDVTGEECTLRSI